MNEKLTNKLFKKYPKIFPGGKKVDPKKSLLAFGIETHDGWYWLIDNLCHTIQNYINQNKHLKIKQIEASQVKEKFGGLRFYTNGGGDELIRGMIWLAESLSYDICEDCGKNGTTLDNSGFIQSLCDECRKARSARLKKRFGESMRRRENEEKKASK